MEYVACKVAVGAGGQKASTLSQLLASSDTSSKTAADFFNVIDVEEDRQARYVEHNAKKNAVRAAKSKARDQVAARVWPTVELWEEFLRDSASWLDFRHIGVVLVVCKDEHLEALDVLLRPY